MAVNSILVVEDNAALRQFMVSSLKKANYRIHEAQNPQEAYGILKKNCLDMVLLDLNLGDSDGIEILRTIRRQDEDLPVIIVSSLSDKGRKINGFDVGCDDYIVKPFYVEELLGRIARLLKRARPRPANACIEQEKLVSGPFQLDLETLEVTKNGEVLVLRKKLFDLFLYFIRHPDHVLSPAMLFDRAWDSRDGLNENSLYVHIRELRTLVEDNPSRPRFIQTVRGAGYRYSPAPS